MKKPILAIWNDAHLKTGNEEAVEQAVDYMIQKLVELKINRLIFAGDLFDSRSFQRQKVLKTLESILSKFNKAGIYLDWFAGNHDKTIYASYDSFLDVYKHFPKTTLHRELSRIEIEGVKIDLLPFFSDDMLIPMLKEANGGDILISHFEMQGSTHLGNVSEKTTINKKLLKKWKKVYLGHYHNYHEISKDIVHLPSFIQASFGEDNNKGFTIINDDLSYDIIKGRFNEFKKIKIDLNTNTLVDVKKLIKTHKNSSNTVRFELSGEESKLKAFDKSIFKDTNIDVKLKYTQKFEYDDNDNKPEIIERFDKESVQESFQEFCDSKGYDYKEGKKILDEFLNT